MCPTNGFKKSALSSFRIYVFFLFALFAPKIWDHILRRKKFWTIFVAFFKSLKMSRNMRKLRVKLRNATIYLPWCKIFKTFFFKNVLLPHLKRKTFSEGDIWKILRRRITDLMNQGPYKSKFCKKSVGALHLGKMGWQSLLYGQMNLNLGSVWWNIPPRSEEVLKSFISVFYC